MATMAINPTITTRTRYRWVVLALMFTLYTIAFADRANIGIALPHIKDEFGLTNAQAGLVAGMFSAVYAICQFPSSLAVKRLGVNRAVPIFMILSSGAAALGGIATSFFMLKASRILLGIVEAPLAISMTTTINSWFPPREKGTAAGIFMASTKFGPVIVPPLGALIIASFGWRYVFFVFAAPGVILAIMWFLMVKDHPRQSRFVSESEALHIEGVGSDERAATVRSAGAFPRLDRLIRARRTEPLETTREVLQSWTVWGSALCYCLVQGVVGVILFLLPLYLTEVKKLSIMNVGFVASAPFAGAVMGNMLGGWISDRVFGGRRKPMMILTLFSTVITMWLLRGAPDHAPTLALILFVIGVLLTLGYSAYSVYAAPLTTTGTFPVAFSIINTMGQVGTAAAPLIVGASIDRFGWNAVFAGLSVCSLTGLVVMLTILEPLPHEPAR